MSFEQDFSASLTFFNSELFKQVQLSGLFADSKTFADAIAKAPFAEIYQQFDRQKQQPGFSLATFVEGYFELPQRPDVQIEARQSDIKQHIQQLWSLLKRSPDVKSADSLLPLQHSYIVPGGRFSEIYYWDSYFTAIGLMAQGEVQLVIDMLDNFVDLQQAIGVIPNGNRSYYYSRSQPPILALMIELLLPHQMDKTGFIGRYLPALEAEYQFWMNGVDKLADSQSQYKRVVRMADGSVLNRYWDDDCGPRPESYREDVELCAHLDGVERDVFLRHIRAACESGWDFSSRWLAKFDELSSIETTDIVPIDLNALLYQLEQTLTACFSLTGDSQKAADMQIQAKARKRAINRYLWCDRRNFYFDYHLVQQQLKAVYSLAAVVPLFVHLADDFQAKGVAVGIGQDFLKSGGLVTTLESTSQQWDAPNGWAPLHWFAVIGLSNYQYHQLAQDIMECWLKTVESFFAANGKLMEKYDVCRHNVAAVGGEYQVQEGFGWTNGVTIGFYGLLAKD